MASIPKEKYGWPIRQPSHHIKLSKLEELRLESDEVADKALEILIRENISIDSYLDEVSDAYNSNREIRYSDNNLRQMNKEITTYPPWLDYAKLNLGQVVFYKYSGSASMGLLYFSLIGGFSAPKIVKVLDQTAYLTKGSFDATFKRLNETLEMILDSIEEPDNLKIGKRGWYSVLKVRFLHCKVRERIKRNNNWDTALYGNPINMEDMIATLMSFSINISETIKKVGAPITKEEVNAYIHLWRYIGYLIGVKEAYNPCTSIERCMGTVESIVLHILTPDARSGQVARHVLRSVSHRPLLNWSYLAHSECARALLGNPLADELGLERSLIHKIYVKMILFIMFLFQYFIGYFSYNHESKLIKKTKRLMRFAVNRALNKNN
jgi:hypothetical protein